MFPLKPIIAVERAPVAGLDLPKAGWWSTREDTQRLSRGALANYIQNIVILSIYMSKKKCLHGKFLFPLFLCVQHFFSCMRNTVIFFLLHVQKVFSCPWNIMLVCLCMCPEIQMLIADGYPCWFRICGFNPSWQACCWMDCNPQQIFQDGDQYFCRCWVFVVLVEL